MYKYFLLSVLVSALFAQQGADYLIITHDDFYQTINSLANWKNRMGMQTKVVKLSEIPPYSNHTADDIKNYIVTAYNSWVPQPRYVLLVGDVNRLPTFYYGVWPTDNPYADMMIGDFRAEIVVGRFAVENIEQCETMVAKVLGYESNPFMQTTDWFKKATLVLNEDPTGNEPYYFTIDYAYNQLTAHGYSQVDKFIYYSNCTGDDRVDVIKCN